MESRVPVHGRKLSTVRGPVGWILAFNGAFLFGLVLLRNSPGALGPFSNLMQVLGPGCAALFFAPLWRGRKSLSGRLTHPHTRFQWSAVLLWLGVCAFVLGQIIWSIYELVFHREVPLPSLADFAFLCTNPIMLLGVLSLPGPSLSRSMRTRDGVDSLMLLTAAVTFNWYFTLGPTLLAGSGELLAQAVGLAYPLGDVILFTSLLLLIGKLQNQIDTKIIAPMIVGSITIIITDSLFEIGVLNETYSTGAFSDIGWPLGFMLIALAASRLASTNPSEAALIHRSLQNAHGIHPQRGLLPYLLLLAVFALLIYTLQNRSDDSLQIGVFIGSIVLVLLIVVRQILTFNENERLFEELQTAYVRLERQNEASRVAQGQLLHIIETAPVSIALFDHNMRYVAHSTKWVQEHALNEPDLRGRTHYEVFPDLPQRLRLTHQQALAGERQSAMEDKITVNGETHYWRWAVTPWYDGPEQVGGIVLCAEQVDDLVAARESALETARLKSEFLATMSHEIRTPMNAIIGMSELLVSSNLGLEERDYATIVLNSSQGLLRIINDILDFSKIEARKLHLEEETIDIRAMIEGISSLFTEEVRHKQLELRTTIMPDVPQTVIGDEGRVRQVLMNLVGNAIKFTDQGYVEIAVSLEGNDTDAHMLRFTVNDTGIGLEETACDTLFQPFIQADGSTTRRYGGTGLGLAISRRLTELMGGTIDVHSTLGAGSTFWFTARFGVALTPEAAPNRAVERSATPVTVSATGEYVLVVEDNPVNRKLALVQLKRHGYGADAVTNGEEAVEALTRQDHPYTLVLMDCQMPVMDGYTATETIRRMEIGTQQHIPIIAMTADVIEGTREDCLRAGMDDYISKPVRAEALGEILAQWASSHQPVTTDH